MSDAEYRAARAAILQASVVKDILMGIQNFPSALQPIIQQGFLERESAGVDIPVRYTGPVPIV